MSNLNSSPNDERPARVRDAGLIVWFLTAYATIMAVPMCLTGAFVGPALLLMGGMLAMLAAVLFISWRGLLRRRRWAQWVLIGVSVVGMQVLPMAVIERETAGTPDDAAMIFPLSVSLLFALLAWTLSRSSVDDWIRTGKTRTVMDEVGVAVDNRGASSRDRDGPGMT